MKILKLVPTPTEVEALWIKRNWQNGGKVATTRRKFKQSVPDCAVCGLSTDKDEMVALACFAGEGNKLIHDSCLP